MYSDWSSLIRDLAYLHAEAELLHWENLSHSPADLVTERVIIGKREQIVDVCRDDEHPIVPAEIKQTRTSFQTLESKTKRTLPELFKAHAHALSQPVQRTMQEQ